MGQRIICKNCNSINVERIGMFSGSLEYLCRGCNQKFFIAAPVSTERESEYHITVGEGASTHYVAVKGDPFVVPGYDEFALFSREVGGLIVISEVNTGMIIGPGYKNIESAHKEVPRLIEQTGSKHLQEIIAKHLIPGKLPNQCS